MSEKAIEMITPQMIEAGSAAMEHRLWTIDPDAKPMPKTYRAIIVREVFEAMVHIIASENEIALAVKAAFAELKRQVPEAVDCSDAQDGSNVYTFTGIDLRLVVGAVIGAAFGQTNPTAPAR